MHTAHSKSTLLYNAIKHALQMGRYAPGARIDPAQLAQEFQTSPTPVRCALYRLVGEGIVDDCARLGFQVPRMTEATLRDLYTWMEHLLVTACEHCQAQPSGHQPASEFPTAHDDPVTRTAGIFDAIAQATPSTCLRHAVRRTNDRLSPVRRATLGILEDASEELAQLCALWHRQDIPQLQDAIRHYHARRRQLVPRTIEILDETVSRADRAKAQPLQWPPDHRLGDP